MQTTLELLNYDLTLCRIVSGFLFEGTGSYTIPFIVAGGFLAFSGAMCYPLNVIKDWEERRNKMKEKEALANNTKA